MMKYKFLTFFLVLFTVQSAYAFEPVPIDEFFKQHPEEQGHNMGGAGYPVTDDALPRPLRILPPSDAPIAPLNMTADITEYKKADFIILNRISEVVKKISLRVGETQNYEKFTITFSICTRKVFPDNGIYTNIAFRVSENLPISDDDAEKTEDKEIYNNHTYLELPGINAFEHSLYDIKAVSCTDAVPKAIENTDDEQDSSEKQAAPLTDTSSDISE